MSRRIALMVVVAGVVAALAASLALAAAPKPKVAEAGPTKVTVTMTEYHFKITPSIGLKHGVPITFTVLNRGKLVHNFDIQGVKATPVAGPGSKRTMVVKFTKAGRYPYVCDVPRHAELGMGGTLVVK
jgi:uncharacterized cupredoxin-like copper-binding protein